MKKIILALALMSIFVLPVYSLLTFYMVDNFEDGQFSKWYVFDNVKASIVNNPAGVDKDSVAESCGEKSLKIVGESASWYAGGMGTVLDIDASQYSRFMMDVYGTKKLGKFKVEIIEKKASGSNEEVKWSAELPVLGEGFTRYSVPFSSFVLDGASSPVFHPKKGGNISKLQLIFVSSTEKGNVDLTIDNIIFTF